MAWGMTSFSGSGGMCEESRRYISNFFVFTRSRPGMEASGEPNSDGLASDDSYLDKSTCDKALETNVGTGRRRAEGNDLTTGKKTECEKPAAIGEHAESARVAFRLAQEMWSSQGLITEATCTEGLSTTEECLYYMKEAASASQREEHGGGPRKAEPREATLREGSTYSAQDIRYWIADVRSRKSPNCTLMYKQAEVAAVETVIDRMCKELEQQAAEIDLEDPVTLASPWWPRHGQNGSAQAHERIVLQVWLVHGAGVPDSSFASCHGARARRRQVAPFMCNQLVWPARCAAMSAEENCR